MLIDAQCVSKKFCKNLKRSMLYGIKELLMNSIGIKQAFDTLRKDEFWAVRNISFRLKRGECLALVGQNGCGKSTLLRLLTGVFPPDSGRITIKGRVGALIALGAGFHPHLSGRENIYLNGSILGLKHYEIKKKLDEIIDFSELEEFVDAPVSTYSSGMRVRLGFAVATAIKPDVLIVDEVLAVGDADFRLKCFNTIQNLISNSCVIFVSHSMPMISRIATRGILLNNGKSVLASYDVSDVIQAYLETVSVGKAEESGNEDIQLVYSGIDKENKELVRHNDRLVINTKLLIPQDHNVIVIRFTVFNLEQRAVLALSSRWDGTVLHNNGNLLSIKTTLKKIKLSSGKYTVTTWIYNEDETKVLKRVDNSIKFQVSCTQNTFSESLDHADWEFHN